MPKTFLKLSIVFLLALAATFAEAAKKQKNAPTKNGKGKAEETVVVKKVEDVPVAEGFPHWKGFETWLPGSARQLTPSDLRGRYAIIVEIKGNSNANLIGQFKRTLGLQGLGFNPSGSTMWDFGNDHRDIIVVYNIHGGGANTYKSFHDSDMLKKDLSKRECNFYTELTFEGAPDSQGDYPFVYVMPPEGIEAVFKGRANDDITKQVSNAIKKSKGANQKSWHDYYGFLESVSHVNGYDAAIAGGKTLANIEATLRKNILSKDPEIAKEAQILYDAIEQRKGDLEYFIKKEYKSSPVAALDDYAELVARFPAMKKDAALAKIVDKAGDEPDAKQALKVYPAFRKASSKTCKIHNAAEAKKLAAEIKRGKASLAKLATSKSVPVQNIALLMQQMADDLVAELEGAAGQ